MDVFAVRKRVRKSGTALLALLALAAASPAAAASRDFVLAWRSMTSPASARGTMTIDDAVFMNPGSNDSGAIPWITALSITVTGASGGNGTFTLADFAYVRLETNGVSLDLDRPLIGQTDGGLFDPAGGSGSGGDFNLFNLSPAAPNGVYYGFIGTNGGAGDNLRLVAIQPVRALPVSAEAGRCQKAIGKAGGKYLATRHAALASCYDSLLAGKPLFEDAAHTLPVSHGIDCPFELKTRGKLAKARLALRAGVEKKCSDALLSSLFACASTVDVLVDPAGAGGCLVEALDLEIDGILADEFGL